jgi:hypothetical protein
MAKLPLVTLISEGPGTITLVLTSGEKFELTEGEYATIEQDSRGQFVRVVQRGLAKEIS